MSKRSGDRLNLLRQEMKRAGVDALIVPRVDQFQNEYVAPEDERLKFVSGFSGTAGFALITQKEAALFTDGRYEIQAAKQLDKASWRLHHSVRENYITWLVARMTKNQSLGCDPALHGMQAYRDFSAELQRSGIQVKLLKHNLVDAIWKDRPKAEPKKIFCFPVSRSGEKAASKLKRVSAALVKKKCDALFVSAPDNLSWLFNIRGHDLEMTPVVFGYALITSAGKATLYIDDAKLDRATKAAILADGKVKVAGLSTIPKDLVRYKDKTILFDQATASVRIVKLAELAKAKVELAADPTTEIKSQKNKTELAGMRASHLRDALAMVKFLRWFAQDRPPAAGEFECAAVLEKFRSELAHFRGLSFNTISAAAENAAQAHYQAKQETSRHIGKNEIYLIDSGGQYLDGTTDITRVTINGKPTTEHKLRYTQVLKGLVALCRQRFPQGITGAQLDSLARQFLWNDGIDYDHGTGHGVGHYLSVHEGPQSISQRGRGVALLPGMVVSIEPGYYKAGAFGIRIENLGIVTRVSEDADSAQRRVLQFEMLTFVPYEPKLIELALLTPEETSWIDAYHARVLKLLRPKLSGADLKFLQTQCAPLSR